VTIEVMAAPPPTSPLGVFQEDMGRLGGHPDKDIIVRLTHIAMQHQDLGNDLVELIQSRVLSVSTSGEKAGGSLGVVLEGDLCN